MRGIIITSVVATFGGLLGVKLKIPAGALLGAMVAVGAYNLLGGQSQMPASVRTAVQILAGAIIGTQVNRNMVASLRDLAIPALILVFGILAINLALGALITKFSNLDLTTALFASAPGGMTEMTLAAESLGADAPKVALLQSLRLTSVIVLVPIILRFFIRTVGSR